MRVKLGVVTDEVSQDPLEALTWARERGLDYVDIRDVYGKNVSELTPDEAGQLEEAVRTHGLPVMTICPQLYRARLDGGQVRRLREDPGRMDSDRTEYAQHTRMLRSALDLARRLGAPFVRTFAFWRELEPEEVWGDLVEAFRLPVSMARRAGRILLLENEGLTYATSGSEAARLIAAVGSCALRAIWDPANAFYHPETPYPDGYRALRGFIDVVHAKDASTEGLTVLGQGRIDWEHQLRALKEDRFSGGISIEPRHVQPGKSAAETCEVILEYLRSHLATE